MRQRVTSAAGILGPDPPPLPPLPSSWSLFHGILRPSSAPTVPRPPPLGHHDCSSAEPRAPCLGLWRSVGISEPGVCRPPPVLNVPGDLISPRHQEVPPFQGNKAQIHLSRIGHSDDTWCQLKSPSAQQPHWHPKTTRPMAHLSFAQPACRGPRGTADGAGPSGGHGPGRSCCLRGTVLQGWGPRASGGRPQAGPEGG